MAESVGRRWLAFDSNRDEPENRDLYLMRADGTERVRLTHGPGAERAAAFSPDGTRLAYVSEYEGGARIHVYDFARGEARAVTPQPAELGTVGAFEDDPAWLPDGKRLVFQRGSALLVVDADGGNERTLAVGANLRDTYRHPAPTPDGREVLADSWHSIVAFDVETGSVRELAQDDSVLLEAPSMAPDGSEVVLSTVCTESYLQLETVPRGGARNACKAPSLTPLDGSRPVDAAWGTRRLHRLCARPRRRLPSVRDRAGETRLAAMRVRPRRRPRGAPRVGPRRLRASCSVRSFLTRRSSASTRQFAAWSVSLCACAHRFATARALCMVQGGAP